jgi:hypothetical protein
VVNDAALFLLGEHIYTSPNHDCASTGTLQPAATAAAATNFLVSESLLVALVSGLALRS